MTDAITLTNTTIPFTFDGKEYQVKRANLNQIIQWQRKAFEIGKENDAGADPRIAAYAIWVILNSVDKNITEEDVLEKCPAVELSDVLITLGFMSQQKMAALQTMRNLLEKSLNKPEEKPTGGN